MCPKLCPAPFYWRTPLERLGEIVISVIVPAYNAEDTLGDCLAALQAPVILMSQNRAAERDRTKAERDYAVNRKAEREIEDMQADLEEIKKLVKRVCK